MKIHMTLHLSNCLVEINLKAEYTRSVTQAIDLADSRSGNQALRIHTLPLGPRPKTNNKIHIHKL